MLGSAFFAHSTSASPYATESRVFALRSQILSRPARHELIWVNAGSRRPSILLLTQMAGAIQCTLLTS
jgi:hypothetical protein